VGLFVWVLRRTERAYPGSFTLRHLRSQDVAFIFKSPCGRRSHLLTRNTRGKLEYDPDKMKITNNPDANKLLKPTFRKGWEFHAVKG
jgi:hypothetical protein